MPDATLTNSSTLSPAPSRLKTENSSILAVLRQARLNTEEIAGSLGDMGTFLPLLVAMSSQNGLDFGTALFFAGFFNVVTGMVFAIPMAVQPMKAIAAIALTTGMSAAEIVAAGMVVSAAVLFFGVTGLVNWVTWAVPKSVIRGLQLALGLSLLIKGVHMVSSTGGWVKPDGYSTALLAALLVLLISSQKIPAALLMFAAGIGLATWTHPQALPFPHFTIPHWSPPAWRDLVNSFVRAALPQIPLTMLNSVIAVCALSSDLFPERPARPRSVAVSVGLMNLFGGLFGAMPMCHGAGGLAGQFRFGARTNGSILFLGSAKMLLALAFGSSLMALCAVFPLSILGVMLAASGIELALVTRDQIGRSDAFIVLLTAGACVGLNSFAIGFLIGLGAVYLQRLSAARTASA